MKTLDIDPMQAGVDSLRGVPFCAVGPNYFTTVEDHIYRGSVFTLSDFDGDIAQVVINRKLADVLWPGKSPVNRTIRLTEPVTGLQFDTQILGIVDDMRSGGAASSTQATIFLPLKGNAFALSFPFWFLARGTYSSHDLESFVQGQAATTMPGMGITRSFSIEDRLQNSWRAQRLRLELGLGGAALLAIIAYLGLYGVLTNAVSSRRRELALRLCFGANAWQLRRIILARAIRCSIAATILSFGSGQLFFRFLNTSWTGGAAWSWQIASATCLVCSFAAIGIAMIPANMAVQISPSQVLKDM
jgi:putative ABC transport system permease protein